MNTKDNKALIGMFHLSRWRLWLLIVLVAFMLPLSGALAADITFDFESNTSPVRDDGATTGLYPQPYLPVLLCMAIYGIYPTRS